MKRKRNKIDIVDLNHKIIKSKMKNPLYVLTDLDKELLNIGYKSKKEEMNNMNYLEIGRK